MILSARIFASVRIIIADYLSIPLKSTIRSIISGIFLSFSLICAVSERHYALDLKFLTLERYGTNASLLEIAKPSIFGFASNKSLTILLNRHRNSQLLVSPIPKVNIDYDTPADAFFLIKGALILS